jgi:hypothetical protein
VVIIRIALLIVKENETGIIMIGEITGRGKGVRTDDDSGVAGKWRGKYYLLMY